MYILNEVHVLSFNSEKKDINKIKEKVGWKITKWISRWSLDFGPALIFNLRGLISYK